MTAIIKTEFQKMKRYHILLIALIGMFCSPLLQLFSQFAMNDALKDPYYDLAALLESTIWGNAQIFLPVMITLTGGYLINREYTDDTLKNILTVPVSFHRFLWGKLLTSGILAVGFGIYSFFAAIIVGFFVGLPKAGFSVLTGYFFQMAGLSVCIYIVVLPLLIIDSRKKGRFMGGAVAAFLVGYACLFFKTGILRSVYPVSAALTVVGFDMAEYTGTASQGNRVLAVLVLGIILLVSVMLVWFCKPPQEGTKHKIRGRRGKQLRVSQR